MKFLRMAFLTMAFLTILSALIAAVFLPTSAQAVIHQVSIGDFFFSPTNLHIAIGDTVRWTNNGAVSHSSTSDNSVWDSGLLSHGQSFSFHFTNAGTFPYHCSVHPFMKDTIHVEVTGIGNDWPTAPEKFCILPNYPNPFNAQTNFSYSLPMPSNVTIKIFDILGRKIETLDEGTKSAGQHQVTWDAASQPSGLYFYRIETGNEAKTGKMILMK